MTVIAVAAGLLTGILSGFGIGGGSLLLLYLTLFAGVDQYQAGGINLLYFIACAPAALYSHIKNGLVQKDAVKWCVAAGVLTSIAAALAAARMDTGINTVPTVYIVCALPGVQRRKCRRRK